MKTAKKQPNVFNIDVKSLINQIIKAPCEPESFKITIIYKKIK